MDPESPTGSRTVNRVTRYTGTGFTVKEVTGYTVRNLQGWKFAHSLISLKSNERLGAIRSENR